MITFFSRGRGPTSAIKSSTVLTLWLSNLRLASSIDVSLCHIFEPDLAGLRDRLRIPQRSFAPVIDLSENLAHAVFEANARAPVEITRDRSNVRMRDIGFAGSLRNVNDLTAQQFDQLVDRLRVAGAEIPDFSREFGLARTHEGFGDIGHKKEIARLRAISDHGERRPGNLLPKKHPEHGTVGAGRS